MTEHLKEGEKIVGQDEEVVDDGITAGDEHYGEDVDEDDDDDSDDDDDDDDDEEEEEEDVDDTGEEDPEKQNYGVE